MRYRAEDNRVSMGLTNTVTNGNTCAQTTSEPSMAHANGTRRSMYDVVVPNFHKRIREGEVIVNPMSSEIETRNTVATVGKTKANTPGSCTDWSNETNRDLFWNYPSGALVQHIPIPIDVAQLMTLAGTEAQANVLAPDFAGATFLAELRKTLSFVRNPFKSIHDLFTSISKTARKGGGKGAQSLNLYRYIEDNWLTYRYGIMPLVFNARDAVNAVNNLGNNPERFTARGSAKNEGEASASELSFSYYWDGQRDWETHREVSVRAGILYEHDTRNSFGVTLRDISAAAWEVVPFSFVADWFVNVNDYIAAITPKVGVRQLGSWTTVYDKRVTSANGYSVGTRSGWTIQSDTTTAETLETLSKSRHVGVRVGLATQPIPYSGDLGKKRILDTIALIDKVLFTKWI